MSLARLDMCAERINRQYKDYSLLDIGCRTMDLKPKLVACDRYFGADLVPGEDVFECDLEQGLPFEDNAFDIITALDILEHLNNPHAILPELFRVARKSVIISLPNMYYISFRWSFLMGRGVSGKYSFPPHPVLDRHRWVLCYDEALRFVCENATGYRVEYEMILIPRGRTKLVSEPMERWLAHQWPNLFAYGALVEVKVDQPA